MNTGELRIDKPLDREALGSSSGVLNLRVRAAELNKGQATIFVREELKRKEWYKIW